MRSPHILIVAGGITGLSAAYYLERMAEQSNTRLEITLVERDNRLGGKLGTEINDGLLIDIGPDSFMSIKPWAIELCRELGMGDEVIAPSAGHFYMYTGGKLHTVPHELVSLVPSKPEALWKASFISLAGKTRASAEGLIKPRGDIEDESLSSFMRRRFGDEFAAHFAEPLMGGVHAGNPECMSMAAIYPMFWEMERKHGSITKALLERRLAARSNGSAQPSSPFVALRHGMQSLVDQLRESIKQTRVLLETSVDRVVPSGSGGFALSLSNGEELTADSVLFTTPAFTTASVLNGVSTGAAKLLNSIPYTSTAVVTLAYRHQDIDNSLEGTGFLVPRDQGLSITGCTWSSNKWEGRAPESTILMRAFLGYAGSDEYIVSGSEETLLTTAHGELSSILGIKAPPLYSRVNKWLNSMPQYEVGHLGKIDQIEEALSAYPALILAGSAYRGVGIPDCVRQGKEAAQKMMDTLSSRQSRQTAAAGNRA